MRKIKFIKKTELKNIGDEANASEENARVYVEQGFAYYIDELNEEKIKEAKFFKDKHILEVAPRVDKISAAAMGISGENYDKIRGSPEPEIENSNEDCSNLTPIKCIDVVPNRIIKTRITISDISPGVNLLKGYTAICPVCQRKKIVYTQNKNTCGTVFSDELKKSKANPCTGQRGGAIEVIFESINDTGYLCGAFDPEDSGSAQQFSNVFFSNHIIPTNKAKREDFETSIQSNNLIVTAKVIILPSTKKVTDWLLDILDFRIEERIAKVDEKLLHFFKDIPRDDVFFKNNFAKRVYGRSLDKKITAITLLSPIKAALPDNRDIWCTPNVLFAGDPGQAKTVLANESLSYCKGLSNAKLISVENSTNRGLIGAVVKNQTTGQHMIKLGQVTKCDRGIIYLDGMGKLSTHDYSELRGIQEERVVQINKAAQIKKTCAVRFIGIANLINHTQSYPTRHRASYDISATTDDFKGKFSGADRRRYAHISILSNQDISVSDTDSHYLSNSSIEDKSIIAYWNNLREFAWSREPDSIKWGDDVLDYVAIKMNDLRKNYQDFALEYGILSKGGIAQFLGQLPAVAILHESIKFDDVLITKSHVDWLYNLYLEEFKMLGLDDENYQNTVFDIHASLIISKASKKLKEILSSIYRYGSQTAVEKAKICSRMEIYRILGEEVDYQIQYEGDKGPTYLKYSCRNGNSSLPELNKGDGSFTDFGRILIKKAAEITKLQIKKIVTPVTLDTPSQHNNDQKGIVIYNDNKNNDNNKISSVSSVSSVTLNTKDHQGSVNQVMEVEGP